MGFDNNNKDLTAANAGRADICNLMHGTSGQGQKTKGKITPEYQWDVSSPDLDPAEHTVGGVCDKTQISAGFYNHAELNENTKKSGRITPRQDLTALLVACPAGSKIIMGARELFS
mmetsp:Transcript_7972/g.14712  ORF Transcript_7972/g.14712 Transcript_7972/m.14712 type:complete len:116 (-) Transcript_7972:140-487(-)